jgi:hypothetical protein
MNLLIKFPTRGRSYKFFNTLDKYYKLLSNNRNVKFLVSIDEDDTAMNNENSLNLLSNYHNLTYVVGTSKSKIHAVNRDMDKASEWDVVLLASDDMIPVASGYDDIILSQMEKRYPDTDGVLFFNDGYQHGKLNTLCILGKKYYDRFGYIYHPEYKSCWSDNEFMEVGYLLDKQIYIPQVIIKHEHPDWGFGGTDNVHRQNQINYKHDLEVYYKHKSNNFGL